MRTATPHNKLQILAMALTGIVVIAVVAAGGCLNPTFVNQISSGAVVPLAPGDTPYIHLLLINATESKILDVRYGFSPDYKGKNTGFWFGVSPESQRGTILPCPVNQIGLGNPNDLTAPAIIITDADGNIINVPASAFPLVLAKGRDFDCGDTAVFTVIDDRNSGYGIQVLPGRVDGATQTGPFTGPDTFEILDSILTTTGTTPTIIP